MGGDLDLAVGDLLDDDLAVQVADAALDLDLVVQELLEGGDVEDLVARGLRSVDDELSGEDSVSFAPGKCGVGSATCYLPSWWSWRTCPSSAILKI